MPSIQDSSHPAGVRDGIPGDRKGEGAYVARNRKANAALSLRLSGASWSEIAISLGYPTPRATMLAVERALVKQLGESDRDQMRHLAGARLDRLLRAVWAKAIDTSDPDQLAAVSRARELIDRHAKLFGLDAPTEIVVHSPSQAELEQWVLKMTASMVPQVQESDIFDGEVVEDTRAIGA